MKKKEKTSPQTESPIQSRAKRRIPTPKTVGGWLRLVYDVLGGMALLVTFYTFVPKLSITSEQAPNPNDIFSIPFAIRNDGMFDLYDVVPFLSFSDMDIVTNGNTNHFKGNDISGPSIERIKAGHSYTIYPPGSAVIVGGKLNAIENSNLTIFVSYKLRFLPITIQERFSFFAILSTDGSVKWHEQ